MDIAIVPYDPSVHDAEIITDLLHRAYKPLADAGLRYMATHQDASITVDRLTSGHGHVVLQGGTDRIIGTVTVYPPLPDNACEYYRRTDVWHFGQFAVDPDVQGKGLGSAIMDFVEGFARDHGTAELALDTSEHAHHLIAYYTRRGYRHVGHVRWDDVNYRSVLMSKILRD